MSNRLLAALLLSSVPLAAEITYQRHIFFDNSKTPDRYFYSEGEAFSPSTLALEKGRLPVDREHFFTPPNALRLEWKSVAGGKWDAEIRLDRWRNQETLLEGDHLIFLCYSSEAIPAAQLPRVQLSDPNGAFTDALSLAKYTAGFRPNSGYRSRFLFALSRRLRLRSSIRSVFKPLPSCRTRPMASSTRWRLMRSASIAYGP